jgi:hypothetical protein
MAVVQSVAPAASRIGRPESSAWGASGVQCVDVSAETLAEAGIAEVPRRPPVGIELAAVLARCLRASRTFFRR